MTATIIHLESARARLALVKFRRNDERAVPVDTLYAPALRGLSVADAKALSAMGWAEVRPMSGRPKQYRVTLTVVGRHYRDNWIAPSCKG